MKYFKNTKETITTISFNFSDILSNDASDIDDEFKIFASMGRIAAGVGDFSIDVSKTATQDETYELDRLRTKMLSKEPYNTWSDDEFKDKRILSIKILAITVSD